MDSFFKFGAFYTGSQTWEQDGGVQDRLDEFTLPLWDLWVMYWQLRMPQDDGMQWWGDEKQDKVLSMKSQELNQTHLMSDFSLPKGLSSTAVICMVESIAQ